ncbi:hypothetical protein K32_40800 [Kaistia sp. 32K]|uniref:DUF502 domain-containing protein n=1 Tax=Kaistia sp. 32K TaxID=2795690 RepID=UPI001916C5D2|nr:DUF502 domain-containing protein [Kaistia sp. 32K]BCP55463.1 hypothetical protein K32_40800 [Kaistia sp. 32K]
MKSPGRRIDISPLGFLKATLLGGLLFLLPVALLSIAFRHAMTLGQKLAEPISKLVPETVIPRGFGLIPLLTILILALFCLAAGLFARTRTGRQLRDWLETSLFGGLPQYRLMKSMAEGLAHVEGSEGMTPVLVKVEEGWQIGYRLEPLEGGWLAVFLPQAPTPMSGNILYMPAECVRPLDLTMVQALQIVKNMGVGSAPALRGIDLGPAPAEPKL